MATPMTADQLLRQLKKWKVPHREIGGWRTRGRDDETGLFFGPVFGGVVHHTGSDGLDKTNRQLIIEGRSDLPGPLAQFGGNDDGVIDIISCHRCNHAGGGDPQVLRAVQNESYKDYPPDTNEHQGSPGAVDGNDVFYGCENYYSGSHIMTKALYHSNLLLWAAICDFHGWSAKSIIGHKEWSDWKPDPGFVDMKQFRKDLQAVIDAGPDGKLDHEVPLVKTPLITKAIRANIAYDKSLTMIKFSDLSASVDEAHKVLKSQRQALRRVERK